MSTEGDELSIRPLRGEAEARFCAGFMAASEPWLTLGLTFDQAFHRLTDSSREVLVASLQDKTVGVLILHLSGPLNGYIQTVAVHPDWRCHGIGTRMLAFAEQRVFRHSPNVFLCVSTFNEHARKLYKRLGYQPVGELPDYLVRGFTEILLRKTRGPLIGFQPGGGME